MRQILVESATRFKDMIAKDAVRVASEEIFITLS